MSLKMEDKQMNTYIPEVDNFVRKDHPYRRLLELVDFKGLAKEIEDCYSEKGRAGYPVDTAFKCLLLQFTEDVSDREMERFLQENLAAKYFCGFKLSEETPDFSYFSVLRKRIGTERLAKMFNKVREALKEQGIIREIFTFVDATNLVSKISTWEERDKAIKIGLEKFNNATADKVASDKEARFGCKGKDKFWYGYKRHNSVDMRYGLINKVAVTKANVSDQDGLKHICPDSGMVIGDKAYSLRKAQQEIKRRGCHSGVILKNNMKGKNKDKDKYLTRLRIPYEDVFSKISKKARYKGLCKIQFQEFFKSLAYNFKKLVRLKLPITRLVFFNT
jgi:IS5 family transposase